MSMRVGTASPQTTLTSQVITHSRNSSNPRQFLYCKKTIAGMLNRHRTEANPHSPLIPVEVDNSSLPEAAKRFSTPSTSSTSVPPVPSTAPTTAFASEEPRDIKPEIITLSDDDEEPPASRETAPVSVPPQHPAPLPHAPSPLAQAPTAKLYQVPGMSKPFPRYLVEVYLSTRHQYANPETSLRMIKGVYPRWVEQCGATEAGAFLGTLEKMALDEDQQGGPSLEEKQRRLQCLTYVASTGRVPLTSPATSRQHSPASVRTQSTNRTGSQPQQVSTSQAPSRPRHSPSPPPGYVKICNKVRFSSLSALCFTDPISALSTVRERNSRLRWE